MGYKHVCLNCKISKSVGLGSVQHKFHDSACTKCKRPLIFVNHSFRPPKKTDLKGWLKAKYLIENGFRFYHVYNQPNSEYLNSPGGNYISYPKTLKEAKEFVEKYKAQGIK